MHKYFRLPDDWTGEQAWAVMEFIYQLEELVWDTYEQQLLKIVGPRGPDPPSCDCTDYDPADDIPV
jgi:hypothetical protein